MKSVRLCPLVVASYARLPRFLLAVVWLCGVGALGTSGHGEQNCLQLFDTYQQGVYVCQEHPDLVVALQIAEEMGREECQRAFEGERWNCSGFSILKAPNVTSMATKEAAYVHALSLAAIAHSVAKMCAIGDITSCSCNTDPLELPTGDGEKAYATGCSDNVGFGVNFAAQFLRLRRSNTRGSLEEGRPIDADTEAFLHNLRTAAEVVRDKTSMNTTSCKCLGVSGTCTFLSCPRHKLSDFSTVAEEMLNIYRSHSCRPGTTSGYDRANDTVGSDSTEAAASTAQRRSCSPPAGEKQFLFLEDSPDYCVRNPAVGSLGTVGRECDPYTTGPNSCENLCTRCGRGHTSITLSYRETCYCSFTYCCEIQCHKCTRTRYISLCA